MKTRILLAAWIIFSNFTLAKEDRFCHVVVVGGGPGGLHTAYQLSKLPKSNPNSHVCLIEKENRFGGRIYDVAMDPSHPELLYGMGALRVMESQNVVRALAKELGLELEYAPYRDSLISSRGFFSFSSDEARTQAYPLVMKGEDALYEKLSGPDRQTARDYPDLRSYIRAIVGTQSYQFLADMSRFRSDFEAPIDAQSYLEYLDEENKTCCNAYYPVGGMSSFTRKMTRMAQDNGALLYLSQPAQMISKQRDFYLIQTPDYNFWAKRVVIAVDARSLNYIGGDIALRIRKQKQVQDLLAIKVVTVTQKWPNPWWLNSGYAGRDIRRAWTTEHCLNSIEIPINPYAANQNVTRSVYDDDMRCVEFWENTYKRLGLKAVEDEIERGLKYLFPKANIPKPLHTVVQIWPAAWYYLKSGTKFSNQQIADWAKEPLPGEDVTLVGESYYLQRLGWSDAAYKSSISTLNAKYGMSL